MKTIVKILLPILIIAAAAYGFNYLKANKAERKRPQAKEKVWQVDVQKVNLEEVAADLALYATIESSSLQTASAPATSIVEEVLVKSGDSVAKGDILLKLDQLDFNHSLDQAKADVLDLKAQITQLDIKHKTNRQSLALEQDLLKLSEAELSRVTSLQQKGLGSDSALSNAKSAIAKQQLSRLNRSTEVSQHKSKKQQLNAKLMRLDAKLAQAELALERSVIKAEFDGIISSVEVANGDQVRDGQALLSLYPKNKLEARTRVPARYQAEIQQMLHSGSDVTASAKIADQVVLLKLDRVAGQASSKGIDVFFDITQGQEWLRVGNFLNLRVQRSKQKDVVKLPLKALYGTNRIYLFDDNRLKGINVEIVGHFLTKEGVQQVLIRHPSLKQNDQIVLTHLPNAITGLKVTTEAESMKGKGQRGGRGQGGQNGKGQRGAAGQNKGNREGQGFRNAEGQNRGKPEGKGSRNAEGQNRGKREGQGQRNSNGQNRGKRDGQGQRNADGQNRGKRDGQGFRGKEGQNKMKGENKQQSGGNAS